MASEQELYDFWDALLGIPGVKESERIRRGELPTPEELFSSPILRWKVLAHMALQEGYEALPQRQFYEQEYMRQMADKLVVPPAGTKLLNPEHEKLWRMLVAIKADPDEAIGFDCELIAAQRNADAIDDIPPPPPSPWNT